MSTFKYITLSLFITGILIPSSILVVNVSSSSDNSNSNSKLGNMMSQLGNSETTYDFIRTTLPEQILFCLKENNVQAPLSATQMIALLSGSNKRKHNYLNYDGCAYLVSSNPKIINNEIIDYTTIEDKLNPEIKFKCYFDGKTIFIIDFRDQKNPILISYK